MPEAFVARVSCWSVGCLPRAFSGSSCGQRLLCILGVHLICLVQQPFQKSSEYSIILAKVVSKIISGQFVDLADLLSANLCAVDQEPHTFLDSKLLVSQKRQLVEILDILTWTEAFTIYQMVLCAAHPHQWPDLTKYKLLIIQTARHSPDRAWLEYDLAFRSDVAATGAMDWGKMNLDLYNFHLRSPAPSPDKLVVDPSSTSRSTSRGYSSSTPYCTSWNNGLCHWPFGECCFRHFCSSCDGAHTMISCPFRNPSPVARLPCQKGASVSGNISQLLLVYIM